MDDDFDSVAGNLKQRSTWLRILFMLGFGLALYVVGIVLLFITLAQALFSILTGNDNRNLRLLGGDLAEYVNQILSFLTYNSESRPFPFSAFPDQADPSEESTGPAGTPGRATETAEEPDLRKAEAGEGAGSDAEVKKNPRIPVPPDERSIAEQNHLKKERTMSNHEPTSQSENNDGNDKASSEAVFSLANIKVNVNRNRNSKAGPELFAGLKTGRTADENGPASDNEEAENQDK